MCPCAGAVRIYGGIRRIAAHGSGLRGLGWGHLRAVCLGNAGWPHPNLQMGMESECLGRMDAQETPASTRGKTQTRYASQHSNSFWIARTDFLMIRLSTL